MHLAPDRKQSLRTTSQRLSRVEKIWSSLRGCSMRRLGLARQHVEYMEDASIIVKRKIIAGTKGWREYFIQLD